MLVSEFTNAANGLADACRRVRGGGGGEAHLGRERGTSPPCPAGRWFCPGPSASSPTTPAHLWSTGPLPGSPASSCGCAARLGSLRHNQKESREDKAKRKQKQTNKWRERNKCSPAVNAQNSHVASGGEGKNKQTNKSTRQGPTEAGVCSLKAVWFLFCGRQTKQDKRAEIQKLVCLLLLPKELLFFQKT